MGWKLALSSIMPHYTKATRFIGIISMNQVQQARQFSIIIVSQVIISSRTVKVKRENSFLSRKRQIQAVFNNIFHDFAQIYILYLFQYLINVTKVEISSICIIIHKLQITIINNYWMILVQHKSTSLGLKPNLMSYVYIYWIEIFIYCLSIWISLNK